MQKFFQAFMATTIFNFELSFSCKGQRSLPTPETDVKQKQMFLLFLSMVRNTCHSPASCFILFLLIKMRKSSLYSFFKSYNYELSFGN